MGYSVITKVVKIEYVTIHINWKKGSKKNHTKSFSWHMTARSYITFYRMNLGHIYKPVLSKSHSDLPGTNELSFGALYS